MPAQVSGVTIAISLAQFAFNYYQGQKKQTALDNQLKEIDAELTEIQGLLKSVLSEEQWTQVLDSVDTDIKKIRGYYDSLRSYFNLLPNKATEWVNEVLDPGKGVVYHLRNINYAMLGEDTGINQAVAAYADTVIDNAKVIDPYGLTMKMARYMQIAQTKGFIVLANAYCWDKKGKCSTNDLEAYFKEMGFDTWFANQDEVSLKKLQDMKLSTWCVNKGYQQDGVFTYGFTKLIGAEIVPYDAKSALVGLSFKRNQDNNFYLEAYFSTMAKDAELTTQSTETSVATQETFPVDYNGVSGDVVNQFAIGIVQCDPGHVAVGASLTYAEAFKCFFVSLLQAPYDEKTTTIGQPAGWKNPVCGPDGTRSLESMRLNEDPCLPATPKMISALQLGLPDPNHSDWITIQLLPYSRELNL